MEKFKKRIFNSLVEFFKELKFIIKNRNQIKKLEKGELNDCPEEEILALVYAHHWTEKKGQPDAEMSDKVKDNYGKDKFEIINLAVRMINFGNLSGSSFDCFLHRLSFGLLS